MQGAASLDRVRYLSFQGANVIWTVNAIAPGLYPDFNVMSKERAKMFEEQYISTIPLGRFGKFREIGLLALYIASPAADDMTGQVLSLDGGLAV